MNIHLPVGELSDALARCKASMSNEEKRYYLCGVHLRHANGCAELQSTDGHRLTRIKLPGDVPAFEGIILSRQCVADIQKNVKRKNHNSIATIALDEKLICIPGVPDITLALIDGTFPDTDRVIPSLEDKKTVTVKTDAFLKAVNAVHGFAEGAGHSALKLSFGVNKLTISAGADGGNATFEIKCGCDALSGPLAIGFNGQYLKDFAKRIESGEIAIHLSDPGSPTRFAGVGYGDEHETFVLMPMRV